MKEGMASTRRDFLKVLGATGGAIAAGSLGTSKEATEKPIEKEAEEGIEKDFTRRFLRTLAELLNDKQDRSDDILALANAYAVEFEQKLAIEGPYDTNLVYAAAIDNALVLAKRQPVINMKIVEYLEYQLHGILQFGIKSLREREKLDPKNKEAPELDVPDGFIVPT